MTPSVVAEQVRETVLDYLRTTFALTDARFERSLFYFLNSDAGLFKGPYFEVRLPFRKVGDENLLPLDVRPSFKPYRHQVRAFERLTSKDGHRPESTLVTTGTGSGKTECFLYPILDHCWRHRGTPGIKAILLYPMNALASDQARRIAQLLWDDERLRGQVTAGLYVGGSGHRGVADREHLIDKREMLRDSPPDILLTNYKMLDFLLLRPEDRRLWQHNRPETLQYLVLDELHTYDGAQGTDVACLIRRLKQRLDCAPGFLCPVGTSATIGGTMRSETVRALTDFASKVFGEAFSGDSVITEDRCDAGETLGEVWDLDGYPSIIRVAELDPQQFSDADAWLDRQRVLWFGEDAAGWTPVELGQHLARHELLRQVLRALGGELKSWSEIDAVLLVRIPEWEQYDAPTRQLVFDSFLALVSHSRREAAGGRLEPFLTVHAQLWLRELRHLVQRVQAQEQEPAFAWHDESVGSPGSNHHWLPLAHCRECGSVGLAAVQREGDAQVRDELEDIGVSWLRSARSCRYIAGGAANELVHEYLCPGCLHVQYTPTCDRCVTSPDDGEPSRPTPTIPIRIEASSSTEMPAHFLFRCPDCGSEDALSMMGSRAPSLLSVAISHLFQSDFNKDKKLLAFTDSVQDASHRAGFFGARTYRFNLRTAIQGAIEGSEQAISWNDLGSHVLDFWGERYERAELVPTLLPSDLRELDSYLNFLDKEGAGVHRKLENQLRDRLSWEAIMEFGLNARVGRTLESTMCSTPTIDDRAISDAANVIALELQENHLLETIDPARIDPGVVGHFLRGIVERLRIRGGVDHPFLQRFIRDGGNWFMLTKRVQPLLSPFGSRSVLPRFLTNRTSASGRRSVFDSIVSRPGVPTWHRDWASRALGVRPDDNGMNDLLREVMRALTNAGLMRQHEITQSALAWGLNPAAFTMTATLSKLMCPTCRRSVVVGRDEAPRWASRPCLHYRCSGTYDVVEDSRGTYYGRIYRSGRLKRIFAQEHTGLLAREERERLEDDFKNGTRPGSPNLFVCTPTLEMGIDIGDLSAAVLCSVPPAPANFLQRVGRAGRTTGNAFCLTVANSRPHDLYFHDEPLEMMAGQVLPPGCFLDAPEMLQRQMVAYAMDAWASQETVVTQIPNRVGFILGGAGRRNFPGRFLEFYRKHRTELTERFLALFAEHLSEPSRQRLLEFAGGERIPELVDAAMDRIQTELTELHRLMRKAKDRLKEIETDPESAEDPDLEKADLEETRKMVSRIIVELRNKYPLNAFTDEGLLPNYAFPEPGVTLESVVSRKREDGQWEYEPRNYVRAASSAIRELAPFNTFYAHGRKLRIDELDVGSKARPVIDTWRLCPSCSFTRRELGTETIEPACPRCMDAGWADSGRARRMIHFRRSRSLATRLEASSVDDAEDREETFYDLEDLIDVGPEQWNGARLIDQLPFGYELLKNVQLQEVNFGAREGAGFPVNGTDVSDKGFVVCLECGRVQDKPGQIRHGVTCRSRKPGNQEKTESVFLFRTIRSEAIRILLPVAEIELEESRASFKAALQLGFRRYFQGDPGHLLVRSMREPVQGGSAARQYLVVFDGVPGGTGFLSELWHGTRFLDLLSLSLEAMQSCRCQREGGRDGCYRCLYAYQSQRDLRLISSRRAQEMLQAILSRRDQLHDTRTLSDVRIDDKIESELEQKFLNALRAWAEKSDGCRWEERVQGGAVIWILRMPKIAWEIRGQVSLGSSQGVASSSRPDFLIQPVNRDPSIRPLAVFCDGLAYHALSDQPQGRIGDDILKRTSILDSERYTVWAVTWSDLEEYDAAKKQPHPSIFHDLNDAMLGRVASSITTSMPRKLGHMNSMVMLIEHLKSPSPAAWATLARIYGLAWLLSSTTWIAPDAASTLEDRLLGSVTHFDAGAMPQVGRDALALARFTQKDWFGAFVCSSSGSLSKGTVDRWVLRLFDEPIARADGAFESSWRTLLQAWNLLQFADGVTVVSSEGIPSMEYVSRSGDALAAEARAALALRLGESELGGGSREAGIAGGPREAGIAGGPREVALAGGPNERRSSLERADLAPLLKLATELGRSILIAVAEAGLPLPTPDFEFVVTAGVCGIEPEIAWPDARIAVLAENQKRDRAALESAGWKVFSHEVPVEELLDALRKSVATGPAHGHGSAG